MNSKKAISAIEKYGALLVYPIHNQKDPASLWSVFFPRTQMRWEWDQNGDTRVSDLWTLRMNLSRSGKVVYTKWYQGRATFFSKEIFVALLSVMGSTRGGHPELTPEARQILDLLRSDSPLSTKLIKRLTDLRGRALESLFQKALKQLWNRLLIVGFGEVDDGAFPSLAIGTTQLLFEDLWEKARETNPTDAMFLLEQKLPNKMISALKRTLLKTTLL